MIEETLRNRVLSEQVVSDIKGTAGTLYAGTSSHINSTRMLLTYCVAGTDTVSLGLITTIIQILRFW